MAYRTAVDAIPVAPPGFLGTSTPNHRDHTDLIRAGIREIADYIDLHSATWASGGGGDARTVRTPEQDGAVGDGRIIFDGACSSTTLTSALEAKFVAGTTPTGDVGKKVWIVGAGTLDTDTNLRAVHEATITARASATSVTISPAVSGAVTNAMVLIGTDDTAALSTWLNRAAVDIELRATPTKIYAHTDVIDVSGVGVTGSLINLDGATLCATTEADSAIRFADFDGLAVNGGTFQCLPTSTRGGGGTEQYKFYVVDSTRVRVNGVTVDGSYAAGFFVEWTSGFSFTNCTSKGTRADAFHFTQGSRNGFVSDCSAVGMSDDGFAVVSAGFTENDFDALCRNVTFHRCKVWYSANHVLTGRPGAGVNQGPWGRGLAFVGADHCGFYDCEVVGSGQAGLLMATETSYNTHLVTNCTADGIRLVNCCRNEIYDHGSVFLNNSRGSGNACGGNTFKRIEIIDSGAQVTADKAFRIDDAGGGFPRLTVGTADGPIRLSGAYWPDVAVDLGGVTPISQVVEFGPRVFPAFTYTDTSWNPASVAGGAVSATRTVTVTGASVGMHVSAQHDGNTFPGVEIVGVVSADNTVDLVVANHSATTRDIPLGRTSVRCEYVT